ncbi:MAG: hypothetical protein QXE79_00810 [Candidatus Bathyarchaeia archaeon]
MEKVLRLSEFPGLLGESEAAKRLLTERYRGFELWEGCRCSS